MAKQQEPKKILIIFLATRYLVESNMKEFNCLYCGLKGCHTNYRG